MRSRFASRPPAFSVIASMRPSTWAGTPEIMRSGGAPNRSGQNSRTRSWSAPMPPDATITAWARRAKVPTGSRELAAPLGDGRADRAHERLEQSGAGAPDDVEPRHRVAVPVGEVTAALGPADHREEPDTQPVQPRALLTAGEVDVGGGPLARPVVFARGVVDAAVEPRAAQPVLQRE